MKCGLLEGDTGRAVGIISFATQLCLIILNACIIEINR